MNAYTVIRSVVRFYLIGTLVISFTHIIHAAAMLGLVGWQAYTVPLFIDGFAVLALAGQSKAVLAHAEDPEGAKRFAFRLQLVAGGLSLIANVFAGATLGEKVFGGIVVAGFLVAEKFQHAIRARKADAADATAEPTFSAADVQAACIAAADAAVAAYAAGDADRIKTAVAAALKKDAANRKRQATAAAKRLSQIAPLSPAMANAIDDAYADAAIYH